MLAMLMKENESSYQEIDLEAREDWSPGLLCDAFQGEFEGGE